VEVNDQLKCPLCNGTPEDIHVVSNNVSVPNVIPGRTNEPMIPTLHHSQTGEGITAIDKDTRICPACGQTIKAAAKFCRFCGTRL
jgi:hypothetical protein